MAGNEDETPQYSLKEREYIGEDGEIHHHTHVWMAENVGPPGSTRGGSGRSGSDSQSGSSRSGSNSGNGGSSSRSSGSSESNRSGSSGSSGNRSSGSQDRGSDSGSSSQRGSSSDRNESSSNRSESSRNRSGSSSSRSGSSRGDRDSGETYGEERGGMGRALLATAVGVAAITAAVVAGRRRAEHLAERERMNGAGGRQERETFGAQRGRQERDTYGRDSGRADFAAMDRERFEAARDSDRARGIY